MQPDIPVLIIGAGFGGLGMAIRLKERGRNDFLIVEKGDDVGGCWRDNTYPGAACDVPSHLYSFSFERHYPWSRRFAPQAEILDYLQYCARKYAVDDRIRFNTEVCEAHYRDEDGLWSVTLSDGDTLTTRALITATGQLNRPAYPPLSGIDDFAGAHFHSARWDHGVDLTGKNVAVVGTGASAIQFVPEVAKSAGHLTLFQRSAAYVLPKPDRLYHPTEHWVMSKLPVTQTLDRLKLYTTFETRVLGFTVFKKAMVGYEWLFQRHLKKQVQDPELRRTLTPDYPMGCKRILMSNNYYDALTRDNVSVVGHGIESVTRNGLVDDTGTHHPADVIIYGTGFQATDFLSPMTITGRDGKSLNDAWRDGAEAYLGITVHGFPNLFMLYGPNTNLGHNSIIYMLESQIDYVLQCIDALDRPDVQAMEVRPEPQSRFNDRLQAQIRNTVWDQGCDSWYKTASGKNTNNWPGFTFDYRRRTRAIATDDYDFIPAKPSQGSSHA
ncbi:cation diffusion facilitator CzcD-associated flavoprotein CzcO [Tamilnaduibacter salinus]|uniref:Cation diffusion facilitator CzcD-associated flavoprotein CzcO n=1 Tax=Tamilnaduibacter salinus TaxID=1484056 RepID=A0A2U1CTI4_9GAMM|nr:NAD(P)/FAD-dependent oxidoreductase [Tamilnaduibacter salinus]PVY70007.1 cation diffusion facilitator CzcD-associated flavoprotein CzcO [Tamilnaduibacter salinus]